jgi:DeoR/GlpR family transcriptional regulator of sugar metabolism
MTSTERLRHVVEAVREAGTIGVAELAALTGVSEMTVRRDLDVLARQGLVERYRGGARSLLARGEEPPFAVRAEEGLAVKRRIAAEVAGLISDGEAVVIDSGTTCLEVARALAGRRITAMPLSLHAVNALSETPEVTLLVPGGRPRPGELALIGPLTLSALTALRFDVAVIGCCGLTAADGLTAYDLDDAAVKRGAIDAARRVIAVAESPKLTRTALAFVAPAHALHTLVTDEEAPEQQTTALASAGVAIHRV